MRVGGQRGIPLCFAVILISFVWIFRGTRSGLAICFPVNSWGMTESCFHKGIWRSRAGWMDKCCSDTYSESPACINTHTHLHAPLFLPVCGIQCTSKTKLASALQWLNHSVWLPHLINTNNECSWNYTDYTYKKSSSTSFCTPLCRSKRVPLSFFQWNPKSGARFHIMEVNEVWRRQKKNIKLSSKQFLWHYTLLKANISFSWRTNLRWNWLKPPSVRVWFMNTLSQ